MSAEHGCYHSNGDSSLSNFPPSGFPLSQCGVESQPIKMRFRMFLKLVLSFFKILVLKFMLTSADVFTDTATGEKRFSIQSANNINGQTFSTNDQFYQLLGLELKNEDSLFFAISDAIRNKTTGWT